MKFKIISPSQSDIFFAQSPSSKYLPWIVGLLICLMLCINLVVAVFTKIDIVHSTLMLDHYGHGECKILYMTIGLMILMIVITSLIIIFTIESQVKAYSDLIETLKLLGASRQYIMIQFRRYNQKMCVKGILIGIVLMSLVSIYVMNNNCYLEYTNFSNDYLTTVIMMVFISLTLITVSTLSSQVVVASALNIKNHSHL